MNPFIVSGFAGEKYFCNRKKELAKLRESFENGRNVTMFSLRRMGKSSLVKYLFKKISKQAYCVYSDIYSAQSFSDLTAITANAVAETFSGSFKNYLSRIGSLVRSLGATLSFDSLTGKPELRFGFRHFEEPEKSFSEVIRYLESQNKKVLMVLDEFQQVRYFSERSTEAKLRSILQKCKNVSFMFLGSSRSTMESIFQDQKKPFYQSTQFMQLREINETEYSEFIREKFKEGQQKISDTQIGMILDMCRRHTYYVQYICNRLYSKVFKGLDEEIQQVVYEVLAENEPVYYNYRNLMTDVQWKFAVSVAKESGVKEPLAHSFISKNDLGSPSSIKRALDSLLKKEIIIFYDDRYIIYDVFFSLWLKSKAL